MGWIALSARTSEPRNTPFFVNLEKGMNRKVRERLGDEGGEWKPGEHGRKDG